MEQYKLETLRAKYDVFKSSHNWKIVFEYTDTVQRQLPKSTFFLPHTWTDKRIYDFITNMEEVL